MTTDAIADWGLLIRTDSGNVRDLLAAAWPPSIASPRAEDEFIIVEGDSGWTGLFCTYKNRPRWWLADRAIEAGYDVIGLDYVYEEACFAERWDGVEWKFESDDPDAVATSHGVTVPKPQPSSPRPLRKATLVEGMDLRILREWLDDCEVVSVPRGHVILAPPYVSEWKADARRSYAAVHYLDDDSFYCIVTFDDGSIGQFPTPPPSGLGWKHLGDVDGETDPRAICRKLGIPEDYMFPPKRE